MPYVLLATWLVALKVKWGASHVQCITGSRGHGNSCCLQGPLTVPMQTGAAVRSVHGYGESLWDKNSWTASRPIRAELFGMWNELVWDYSDCAFNKVSQCVFNSPFKEISTLAKVKVRPIESHVWQVSWQLSCGEKWQLQTWYLLGNKMYS